MVWFPYFWWWFTECCCILVPTWRNSRATSTAFLLSTDKLPKGYVYDRIFSVKLRIYNLEFMIQKNFLKWIIAFCFKYDQITQRLKNSKWNKFEIQNVSLIEIHECALSITFSSLKKSTQIYVRRWESKLNIPHFCET